VVEILAAPSVCFGVEKFDADLHWDVLQEEATQAESVSGLPMFGERFPS